MSHGDGNIGDSEQLSAARDAPTGNKRLKLDFSSAESVSASSAMDDHDLIDFTSEDSEECDYCEGGSAEEEFEVIQSNKDEKYKILTTKEVFSHMENVIKESNDVLQLNSSAIRILLNHFNWDNEKLLEAFCANDGDVDKLFNSCKLSNPLKVISEPLSEKGLQECEVCLGEYPMQEMYGLYCGHKFCNCCWTTHLKTKIMSDGVSYSICCPKNDCGAIVQDDTVSRFVTDPKVIEMYQHLLATNFVNSSRSLRWCPSPGCTNAIQVKWPEAKPVKCKCGFTCCFLCGHGWHEPVKCQLLQKWIKKCNDDSETSKWIQAHTKDCPKCHAQIEKDGGCNHMTCTNQACYYEFCWICLKKWPHTGDMSCNRFDPEKQKNLVEARIALQRYLFYFDRYMNHLKSLKFEHKLYATVESKMAQMQENGMPWIEVQFLNDAVDILCKCRQVLMYTYCFAFYLEKNNECIIFEGNQADLQQATEDLSEILEKEDDKFEDLSKFKQQVQDKYLYCEKRRAELIKHVNEGYEKDTWSFKGAERNNCHSLLLKFTNSFLSKFF